ncbi:DEAD/DEAH box helicase family protein [Acanthopleuribacter pedis]|uniref:DNA 3'-5' helicase n=1 Tax=Acanthopleuribacter pedis TaxID=442870 RepID=A0A8J7QIV1_9BACT|nr:DEAD/DEAH box helicase family protein [Acanthopleuribacter pedis]MBO1319000.1 DEAD/DEAH box helicase family protein [Acanthopleuribacter pedis]
MSATPTEGATAILAYHRATLTLKGLSPQHELVCPELKWDKRALCWRAPARRYRELVTALRQAGVNYRDEARDYGPLPFQQREAITPRPYQAEALAAWRENGNQGVVVLPTGAGKTILAVMAMAVAQRPTLIHVPTIDLLIQWHQVLEKFFNMPIGRLGGGYSEIEPITVSTYDSMLIHLERIGNRFGTIIFDECHRLPGDQYQFLAIGSLAPFRLGLTATPERSDGREEQLYDLCGGQVYRAYIHDLTGYTLAPYEVETVEVEMDSDEREAYEAAYTEYISFLRGSGIDFRQPNGWAKFIWQASKTPHGRAALRAYQTQKKLSLASHAKRAALWAILQRHVEDRIIVFTQDNESAYDLGRLFVLPVLTHQTKPKERVAFLDAFRSGRFRVLVTSKVLNEGVDVPEANVAVVVSGSGSVREHVQRLGRILRARPGKTAKLYELIAKDTREYFVNQRRKKHHAYQGPDPLPQPQGHD